MSQSGAIFSRGPHMQGCCTISLHLWQTDKLPGFAYIWAQLVGCQPSQGTPVADMAHFESIYLFIATHVYIVNTQRHKQARIWCIAVRQMVTNRWRTHTKREVVWCSLTVVWWCEVEVEVVCFTVNTVEISTLGGGIQVKYWQRITFLTGCFIVEYSIRTVECGCSTSVCSCSCFVPVCADFAVDSGAIYCC